MVIKHIVYKFTLFVQLPVSGLVCNDNSHHYYMLCWYIFNFISIPIFSRVPNFRFIRGSHRSAKKKNPRKFPPFTA